MIHFFADIPAAALLEAQDYLRRVIRTPVLGRLIAANALVQAILAWRVA